MNAPMEIPPKPPKRGLKIGGGKFEDKPMNDSERIRLAMWFIDKVGGTDIAKRAITAACAAIDAMKGDPC